MRVQSCDDQCGIDRRLDFDRVCRGDAAAYGLRVHLPSPEPRFVRRLFCGARETSGTQEPSGDEGDGTRFSSNVALLLCGRLRWWWRYDKHPNDTDTSVGDPDGYRHIWFAYSVEQLDGQN